MSSFNWERFLKRWSREMIAAIVRDQGHLPPAILRSEWLGYPGATEQQIAQAEARLGTSLPSSYRAFLKVSNGWRRTPLFSNQLWSTEEIEWFAVRNQAWIDDFLAKFASPTTASANSKVAPPSVPDEAYFVYGEAQDCSQIRPEYLQTALEISQHGDGAIYLLNPQVVTPDGEWEAWFFGDWLPGADRYPSFQDMMQAEYESFLELQETTPQSISPLRRTAPEPANPPSAAPVTAESPPPTPPPIEEGDDDDNTSAHAASDATPVAEANWQHLATFLVQFQVRQRPHHADLRSFVRHVETDATATRSDLDIAAIQQWMQAQLTDCVETAQSSAPLSLEITQLRVIPQPQSQQSLVQPSATTPTDAIGRGEPFAIEVALNFVGADRESAAHRQIVCRAQCVAHHLATRLDIDLGDITTPISRDAASIYKTQFPQVRLQQPGLYRLKVWVTLQNRLVAPGYGKLPMLLVV